MYSLFFENLELQTVPAPVHLK